MAVPLRKLDLDDDRLPLLRLNPRKKPKERHPGHGLLWLHITGGIFIGGAALAAASLALAIVARHAGL